MYISVLAKISCHCCFIMDWNDGFAALLVVVLPLAFILVELVHVAFEFVDDGVGVTLDHGFFGLAAAAAGGGTGVDVNDGPACGCGCDSSSTFFGADTDADAAIAPSS